MTKTIIVIPVTEMNDYRGVKVGDEYLKEKVEIEAKIYGNMEISEEAKEVLNYPINLQHSKNSKLKKLKLR